MRHRWALLEHGSRFPHSTPVKEISLPLRAGEIQDVRMLGTAGSCCAML